MTAERNESGVKVAVERQVFGFVPEPADLFLLARVNRILGLELGYEVNPTRINNPGGLWLYGFCVRQLGVEVVGVHGPLQASFKDYLTARRRMLEANPAGRAEANMAIVWGLLFGGMSERYLRWVKESPGAYLMMHPEVVLCLEKTGDWGEWKRKLGQIRVLFENGYGRADGITDERLYEPQAIKGFADGRGSGTALDVSHAARAGVNIACAYETMKPKVIHLSGGSGGVPQEDEYDGQLKELLEKVANSGHKAMMVISAKGGGAIAETEALLVKYGLGATARS